MELLNLRESCKGILDQIGIGIYFERISKHSLHKLSATIAWLNMDEIRDSFDVPEEQMYFYIEARKQHARSLSKEDIKTILDGFPSVQPLAFQSDRLHLLFESDKKLQIIADDILLEMMQSLLYFHALRDEHYWLKTDESLNILVHAYMNWISMYHGYMQPKVFQMMYDHKRRNTSVIDIQKEIYRKRSFDFFVFMPNYLKYSSTHLLSQTEIDSFKKDEFETLLSKLEVARISPSTNTLRDLTFEFIRTDAIKFIE